MRCISPRIEGLEEVMLDDMEDCLEVCVAILPYRNPGKRGMITRWRLTDDEKQRLMDGEDLYLNVMTYDPELGGCGEMHPLMISVGVGEDWLE